MSDFLNVCVCAALWSRDSLGGNGAQETYEARACGLCWLLKDQQHLHPAVEHHLRGCGRVHLFCPEPEGEEPQPQRHLHSYCGGWKYVIKAHNAWRHQTQPLDREWSVSAASLVSLFFISPFLPHNVFALSSICSFSKGGWQHFDGHHRLSAGRSHWFSHHWHGDKGLGCSLPAEGWWEEVSNNHSEGKMFEYRQQ